MVDTETMYQAVVTCFYCWGTSMDGTDGAERIMHSP